MTMLTPSQIAERWGVSQSTVYGLVKAGRVQAYRVGCRGKGKILISQDDWEAFLATCRVAGRTEPDDGEYDYL